MYGTPKASTAKWFIAILVAFVVFFLLAAVIMVLWNEIVTYLFTSRRITYIQAAGLLLLCKLLFSPFPFTGRRPPFYKRDALWKEKWAGMNDQQKAQFKEEWKKRCEQQKQAKG